jgi:hypothetical protein
MEAANKTLGKTMVVTGKTVRTMVAGNKMVMGVDPCLDRAVKAENPNKAKTSC